MSSNTDTTDPKNIGIAFAIFFAVVGVGILLGLGSVYLDDYEKRKENRSRESRQDDPEDIPLEDIENPGQKPPGVETVLPTYPDQVLRGDRASVYPLPRYSEVDSDD